MSDSNQSNKDLFEIFKQETSTNLQYLIDNLLLFEENPVDKSKLESIMRAAHSLKGAARIIGFNIFSHFAHLLEDCFVAIQKKNLILRPEDFDSLLQAIDFLKEISELSDDTINNWDTTQRTRMESITQSILQITDLKDTLKPTSTEPLIEEQSNSALFLVFKNEILAQTALIKEEIEVLRKMPSTTRNFSDLLECVLSIKGTSNIAYEPNAEVIAQSLENIINELKSKQTEFNEDVIKKIFDLVDELIQLTFQDKEIESKQEPESLIKNEKQRIEPPIKPIESQLTPKSLRIDQFVRVSAINLNRLIGLAAEFLVETRRLEPIKQDFLQLKLLHHQLATLFNIIPTDLSPLEIDQRNEQIAQNINQQRINIQNQIDVFDVFAKKNNTLSSKLYNEVLSSRMRPFSEGLHSFPLLVRNLAQSLNKKIALEITGNDTPVDRDILEKLDAPLNHIIRNACDHGIEKPQERLAAGKNEKGFIKIDAQHINGMLIVTISDDGKGIDKQKVRERIVAKNLIPKNTINELNDEELFDFLFLPGFTTTEDVTEISGRGVGLDVVRNFVQEIGGKVRIQSIEGQGTTFILQLPITRSVLRALSVEINNEPYAIPLNHINKILEVKYSDILTLEDRDYFTLEGKNVALFSLRQVLGFPSSVFKVNESVPVITLREKETIYSLVIDKILTETELVVHPLDPKLGKIPCVAAGSITDEGIPVLILDVDDILKYIEKLLGGEVHMESFSKKEFSYKHIKSILVVDDSLTIRETERHILEGAGYQVDMAVDGVDALNSLKSKKFNLIITDIDMPRMNGWELIQIIKKDPLLKTIPVIIVSSKDSRTDRLKGKEFGADCLVSKNSFKDQTLIDSIKNIIGPSIE